MAQNGFTILQFPPLVKGMGEMLGLTWDCVNIEPDAIRNGNASIFVNKELQRVNREAFEKLDGKGVMRSFPAVMPSTSTRLVLKEPKTKTSIRKVFLPRTVADMLGFTILQFPPLVKDQYIVFNVFTKHNILFL